MAENAGDKNAKSNGSPYPFNALSDEAKLHRFDEEITMNFRNIVNFNPKVMGALRKTVSGPIQDVAVGPIDDLCAEVGLAAAATASEWTVSLTLSENQRTAKTTFTRLVTKYPALRVKKGFLRRFKVTERTEGGVTFLVLDALHSTVEPVPKRKKKSDDSADSGQTEPAKAKDQTDAAAGKQGEQA